MSIILNNESRPDLAESIRENYTAEHLFPVLFPTINVYEEAGQISVATYITVSGDTNRAYNSDLTLNHFGNTPVSYSTSAFESRVALSDYDFKAKGDDLSIILPEAANVAAEGAVGDYEALCPAILAAGKAGGTFTATSAAPWAAFNEAACAVADYGEPALFVSQWYLNQMLTIPAFTEPLLKLFGEGIITGIIGGSDTALKAVAGWAGLPGGLHIGKDKAWKGTTGSENPAYVVAIRPEMRDKSRAYWVAKAKATMGASLVYTPRGNEDRPWTVDTVYLPGPKLNAVDVTMKACPKVFNGKAIASVALPA